MKLLFLAGGLALGGLAGCTSNSEKQAVDAVAGFYGGSVRYGKGSHYSTTASEPQGAYQEVTLSNAHLGARYDDLSIPASNCAYLTYRHLLPAERQAFNYLKVTLEDSATTHSYTYPQPELQAFSAAAAMLPVAMGSLQQQDYSALAGVFNPAALGADSAASLPARLAALGKAIGPVHDYTLHGCSLLQLPVAGRRQQFVQLLVVVPQGPKFCRLLLIVNPRLRSTGRFLYGLEVLH